jgi:hypothetical protein
VGVKVLFIEGKNQEILRGLARQFFHPYRLLYRKEQELYLLEAWAIAPEMEAAAQQIEGVRSWSFEMIEEGMIEE